jgi:copper resistance protein B
MRLAILFLSLASVAAAAADDHAGMSMREHMDDDPLNVLLMLDRLELRDTRDGAALSWGATAWIGRDFNKLLLRSEGERIDGRVVDAELSAFWARPVSRWWSRVIGARHDFEPRAARSWLAFGVDGLAPWHIHVQATAYLGEQGRTALRLETEYEMLLTNRLILQPRAELNAYGKADRDRGIGSGLSDLDIGLRLRYELRREVAPYLGVSWVNRFGNTADIARLNGGQSHELQVLAGLRVWY